MNTHAYDASVAGGPIAGSGGPGARLRRWWSLIAGLIVAAIFLQAVFAGAMLSGFAWARQAHRITAGAVILVAAGAALAALLALRRVPHGRRLGLMLLILALTLFAQSALGALSAKGANLIWLHVPLGVALVGMAAQILGAARRLGEG